MLILSKICSLLDQDTAVKSSRIGWSTNEHDVIFFRCSNSYQSNFDSSLVFADADDAEYAMKKIAVKHRGKKSHTTSSSVKHHLTGNRPEHGKSLRQHTPRSSHAEWSPLPIAAIRSRF